MWSLTVALCLLKTVNSDTGLFKSQKTTVFMKRVPEWLRKNPRGTWEDFFGEIVDHLFHHSNGWNLFIVVGTEVHRHPITEPKTRPDFIKLVADSVKASAAEIKYNIVAEYFRVIDRQVPNA